MSRAAVKQVPIVQDYKVSVHVQSMIITYMHEATSSLPSGELDHLDDFHSTNYMHEVTFCRHPRSHPYSPSPSLPLFHHPIAPLSVPISLYVLRHTSYSIQVPLLTPSPPHNSHNFPRLPQLPQLPQSSSIIFPSGLASSFILFLSPFSLPFPLLSHCPASSLPLRLHLPKSAGRFTVPRCFTVTQFHCLSSMQLPVRRRLSYLEARLRKSNIQIKLAVGG